MAQLYLFCGFSPRRSQPVLVFLFAVSAVCGQANFVPSTPCRLINTRLPNGPFGGPFLAANSTRNFAIPSGGCSIPSTAVAYSLNITVVPPGTLVYLTVWPQGQSQPVVSSLNSDGRSKAVAAIIPAGNCGGISVYASDATNLIIDINGYFAAPGTSGSLAFYPMAPCRAVDTRGGGSTSQVGLAAHLR